VTLTDAHTWGAGGGLGAMSGVALIASSAGRSGTGTPPGGGRVTPGRGPHSAAARAAVTGHVVPRAVWPAVPVRHPRTYGST